MGVAVEQQVSATPDEVWAVLGDVRRWPEWLPTVDAVVALDPDRPDEVGASYAVTQPRLGTATWTVTRWEPGRGFTWRSSRGGVVTTGTHDLAAAGAGSVVRLSIDWSGPLAFLGRLIGTRTARDYVHREAEALATRVGS